MDPTDADLMSRWQEGDTAAFEALVRRWQGSVARLLARLAGPDAAADLCQDVFLRLYRARDRYREEGAFAGWLTRIAVNAARDAARRRPPTPEPLADREPADAFTPADALRRREAVALVTQALAELPEPLREVLVLRHYQGLAFEEIARLIGTPATTLKSRFGVALRRLRDRLIELGWTAEDEP